MSPHELTDSEKRTLAAGFWRGAHVGGEPLTWDSLTSEEQRELAATNVRAKSDNTQVLLQTVAKMLVAIETCQRGIATLMAKPTVPKGLGKIVATVIRDHARSRGESETSDARIESLIRSQIRSVDGLVGLVEGLEVRVRKLEQERSR